MTSRKEQVNGDVELGTVTSRKEQVDKDLELVTAGDKTESGRLIPTLGNS